MKDEKIVIATSKEMKEKLARVTEENGLNISSVVRRGILQQLNQLQKEE